MIVVIAHRGVVPRLLTADDVGGTKHAYLLGTVEHAVTTD